MAQVRPHLSIKVLILRECWSTSCYYYKKLTKIIPWEDNLVVGTCWEERYIKLSLWSLENGLITGNQLTTTMEINIRRGPWRWIWLMKVIPHIVTHNNVNEQESHSLLWSTIESFTTEPFHQVATALGNISLLHSLVQRDNSPIRWYAGEEIADDCNLITIPVRIQSKESW